MSELRPRNMKQGDLAALLRENGFPACSKAAVSLAERPNDTGVQFTAKAKNVIRGQLNSPRRKEKRVNPNKTTVWLDDDTRIWLEERAYMEDTSVGALIRKIIGDARTRETDCHGIRPRNDKEKAASAVGATEAAEMVPNDGRADVVIGPYGHPDHNTNERGKQDETV